MTGWTGYWRTVSGRVKIDRSAIRIVWVVAWLTIKGWLRQAGRTPIARIAYYPHPGGPWYTLPLALRYSEIVPTRRLDRADIVMIFDDRTDSRETADNLPPEILARPRLNAEIADISKAQVGAIFAAVFGYSIRVEPRTHTGPMVEKSEVNGVHDGRIVIGPIDQPKDGYAYQKLVQCNVREGVTEDLRCTCVGGRVVQVFRKEKTDVRRFSTQYLRTELQETDAVFSTVEQGLIAAFCQAIGLDFGSIDVLRDYGGDGRIYIVDVNKTCMPVLSMPVRELEAGLRTIGVAAEALIQSRIHQGRAA